jgi:signal transduction histidine kinase
MRPSRPGIRLPVKIIAWSFIPTAIILLLVAITTYFAYQQVTGELVIRRDEELTRLSASELSAGFEDSIDRLNALARLPVMYQGVDVQQRAMLSTSANSLVFFDAGVYVLNTQGMVVGSVPNQAALPGANWSNHPFFKSMVLSPGLTISDIEPDGPNGVNVIVFAVPVLNENNDFKGAILGMFRLDASAVSTFYGTIVRLRLDRSGKAYIVDGNHRIIYASDSNAVGQDFSAHPIAPQALSGQVGALRTLSIDGSDIVAGFSPVPRTNWTLIVEENWSDLLRPALVYRPFLLILLAMGVLIPSLVVMVGVRRITGPVTDFIGAAQRIAGGDFSQHITVDTGDELEDLADQFNLMADQLRESYETLESRVEQRTHELTAVNSVSSVVSRSLDLDQILPDALAKTIEVMGMDAGAVFRLDEETDTLSLVASQNVNPELLKVDRLPLEISVIDKVVHTRLPAAQLVSSYPPGPIRSGLESGGWKLVVSIPLIAQEKVLGGINVLSHKEAELTPEELAVPSAIGQQIGVAIENARLYAQSVAYAAEMEAARASAEAANASKSIFLANVSHELRTPLVSILGFARIVQKRLEERIFPLLPGSDVKTQHTASQVQENLGIILEEGQRLTTLINNLLDLEKIEAGKMEWRLEPVDVAGVVAQAVAATASLVEEKSLILSQDVPPGLPQVCADRDKLLQVVINLISNAVKFTPQGNVTIQVLGLESEVQVGVSDQGIGIDPEDQRRVFEKFTQVGDSLTSKPKGTGLGLAISKEIIEHHGGRIWVESQPGKGSTFFFTLPLPRPG